MSPVDLRESTLWPGVSPDPELPFYFPDEWRLFLDDRQAEHIRFSVLYEQRFGKRESIHLDFKTIIAMYGLLCDMHRQIDQLRSRLARYATPEELMEQLAKLAKEQWGGWLMGVLNRSQRKSDGSYVIPPDLVEQWMDESTRPYRELSDFEQSKHRAEAEKVIRLFRDGQA